MLKGLLHFNQKEWVVGNDKNNKENKKRFVIIETNSQMK